MIIACPSCTSPYQLRDSDIAPLVQVECPSCNYRVILDFEAANNPALVEAGTQTTNGYRDEAAYHEHAADAPAPAIQPAAQTPAPTSQPAPAPAPAAQPAPAPRFSHSIPDMPEPPSESGENTAAALTAWGVDPADFAREFS